MLPSEMIVSINLRKRSIYRKTSPFVQGEFLLLSQVAAGRKQKSKQETEY